MNSTREREREGESKREKRVGVLEEGRLGSNKFTTCMFAMATNYWRNNRTDSQGGTDISCLQFVELPYNNDIITPVTVTATETETPTAIATANCNNNNSNTSNNHNNNNNHMQ